MQKSMTSASARQTCHTGFTPRGGGATARDLHFQKALIKLMLSCG